VPEVTKSRTPAMVVSVPVVAHASKRAVFALLRTHLAEKIARSHECERGTQECVGYKMY